LLLLTSRAFSEGVKPDSKYTMWTDSRLLVQHAVRSVRRGFFLPHATAMKRINLNSTRGH
jgi:hypothetical protein